MSEFEHHVLALLHEGAALLRRIDGKLDALARGQRVLTEQGEHEMQELDDLKAEIAADSNIISSAAAALNAFIQKYEDLANAGGTPAEFAALTAQLRAVVPDLSSAVANIPA